MLIPYTYRKREAINLTAQGGDEKSHSLSKTGQVSEPDSNIK